MTRTYQHWIAGKWHDSGSGDTERRSPAHGGSLATFATGTAGTVDAAVRAAQSAFAGSAWGNLPASGRAALLNRWADLIERDREMLAQIEAEEVGKPIRFARAEVEHAVAVVRYAAALAWQLKGEVYSGNGADNLGLATREPIGVVGLIVPWNFPLVCLIQKLPFALAAGCTAVVKPSELTSGTALEVAVLAREAGFPDGVINVVTGYGATVGNAIAAHADIGMVSFTGSTHVGKQIARTVADRIGRLTLELGGKGANIVFADADIEAALDGVLLGITVNQGEECCAGSRLLVDRSIAETFTRRLVERAGRLRLGQPLDADTDLGPMIHEPHMQRVLSYVEQACGEGARVRIGGTRATGGALGRGWFVPMTVLDRVTPAMTIAREEVFGPVLAVIPFDTAEEAVAIANDSAFGLANGVWTGDVSRAHQVSRRLCSGTVYVNTYLETALQLPFGGRGQSGLGREMGMDGVHAFTELKTTFLKFGSRTPQLPHTAETAASSDRVS